MYADEYDRDMPPWRADLGEFCNSLGLTPSCLFNAGQIGILYQIYQNLCVWRNFRRNHFWEQNRLRIKIKSLQWYVLLQMGSGHQLVWLGKPKTHIILNFSQMVSNLLFLTKTRIMHGLTKTLTFGRSITCFGQNTLLIYQILMFLSNHALFWFL